VSDLETAWRQVLDAVDRIPGSVFVVFNAAFPDSGDSPVYSCSIGYATEEEAAKAYDCFLVEYFGEFAQPNFPEGA
jgi:hypothetical protein